MCILCITLKCVDKILIDPNKKLVKSYRRNLLLKYLHLWL